MIVGGAIVVVSVMRHWGFDALLVSEADILDGLARDSGLSPAATRTSRALLVRRIAEITGVDVEVFGQALTELSLDDIRSIAVDLHAARTSTADEVAEHPGRCS